VNFVLFQILWTLTLLLFLVLSYFAARVFTQMPFKKTKLLFEVLLCLVVFSYLLAFRVNF